MDKIVGSSTRTLLVLLGWVVLLLGIVMILAPGPGWLVVFLGLSLLAREFTWARRLHEFAKREYHRWLSWFEIQPTYIKVLFTIISFVTFMLILWLSNAFWFVAYVLQLDTTWLESPFFR